MSVTELATEIGVDQPRASRLVQAAVHEGLVVREADPDDALVVDGYAGLDPLAPGVITLRTTEVTTSAQLAAKRAAQASAREGE